jgi:hypothetical protein
VALAAAAGVDVAGVDVVDFLLLPQAVATNRQTPARATPIRLLQLLIATPS